jgi:hypothetical protein
MKTKINVELKAIKHFEAMSEETQCFTANIYLNGKKVCVVKNEGHGGCNFYDYTFKDKKTGEWKRDRGCEQALDQWADSHHITYEMDGETCEVTGEFSSKLDWLIDEMLEKALELKDLKRWCRRQTLIQIEGDDKHTWRQFPVPFSQVVKDVLMMKFPTITRIANEEILKR